MTSSLITALRVEENKRLAFLPKHFGKLIGIAERRIYDTLRGLSHNYTGGFWDFYELSNNGFYMAPNLDEKLEIFVVGNQYEGILSGDAAGILACLYVTYDLSVLYESERLLVQYGLLLEFAEQHNEATAIFKAMD